MDSFPILIDHYGNTREGREILPPKNTRWTDGRKYDVLIALEAKIVTPREVLRMYNLSVQELRSWIRHYREGGRDGLKTTRLHEYRKPVVKVA